MDVETRKQKAKADEDRGFQEFMQKSETKLMLSLIPASEHQDVMTTLLRSAFDFGLNVGAGNAIGGILEVMFKDKKKD